MVPFLHRMIVADASLFGIRKSSCCIMGTLPWLIELRYCFKNIFWLKILRILNTRAKTVNSFPSHYSVKFSLREVRLMSNQNDYSLLYILYVIYNIRVKRTLSPKDTVVQFILVTVSESNTFKFTA